MFRFKDHEGLVCFMGRFLGDPHTDSLMKIKEKYNLSVDYYNEETRTWGSL